MKPEIEICRFLDAHISDVWKAITDKTWMKQWYFDLKEFKPEVGFTFEFVGGHENGIQYHHICVVTEVIFEKKLVYSWNQRDLPLVSGSNTRRKSSTRSSTAMNGAQQS